MHLYFRLPLTLYCMCSRIQFLFFIFLFKLMIWMFWWDFTTLVIMYMLLIFTSKIYYHNYYNFFGYLHVWFVLTLLYTVLAVCWWKCVIWVDALVKSVLLLSLIVLMFTLYHFFLWAANVSWCSTRVSCLLFFSCTLKDCFKKIKK